LELLVVGKLVHTIETTVGIAMHIPHLYRTKLIDTYFSHIWAGPLWSWSYGM